ncbi:MAG: hypothetical protein HY537_09080 [Deltaproteobacteria bacterium]|nr:hypothetical protein [Deltaproteobacteria bacterium]
MKKMGSARKRKVHDRETTHTDALKGLGVFRLKDAKKLGVSQPTLSRLVFQQKILRVGHGWYLHPGSAIEPQYRDFAVACAMFGSKSVVGGPTALFHHNLIEQVPNQIWILVDYSQKTRDPLYRCLRTKVNPKEGVEDHKYYRITNIERSIVEAMRYASKWGQRTAIQAARNAIAGKLTSEAKIYRQAKALGLQKVLEKYWEAVVT